MAFRRVLVFTLTLLTFTLSAAQTFQNPVLRNNFPDPFVLEQDGTYYAYATNGASKNVQLSTSEDLVSWTIPQDAMPALAPWVRLSQPDVWAPEVLALDGRYLLYYTARDAASGRQCIGVAASDAPEGKFRDASEAPFICQVSEGGSIDAHPFQDEDGTPYLYWKNDGNCCGRTTHIYVQELTPDGLGLVGEPTQLVRNDQPWEGGVVEAPTMWNHEGDYYLFFSANGYGGHEYAVGYATCASATGPCEDAPENPILKSRLEEPFVIGPGHQTIIQDDDGETWLVYHVWQFANGIRGDSRFMWIDPLEWQDGKPVVRGPTTEPQEVP